MKRRGFYGPFSLFSFSSPNNSSVPNVRSCLVSFTDTEGIEHSVRVPAESLYEAAVEALAAFRRLAFAEVTFGSATKLRIRVRAPEEEHTVTVGKVMSWLAEPVALGNTPVLGGKRWEGSIGLGH